MTPPETRLYVRRNPRDADSVEIIHLTISPNTITMVHFWGATTIAPPDLFGDDPLIDLYVVNDLMSIGDYGTPDELEELHAELTGDDPESFHGNGWTLLPSVGGNANE